MKVVYIANMRLPTEKAHGYQIFQMCQAFVKQGCSLELIVPYRKNEKELSEIQDVFTYYNIKENFFIKKVFAIDTIFLTSFSKRLQFFGNLFHLVSFSLGLIFYLLFLKDKKKTIIYIRDINILSIIHSLLGFLFPFVCLELHSLPVSQNRFYRYIKILKRVPFCVVMTKAMKDILAKEGLNPEKVLVSHDAVDLTSFDISITREEALDKVGLNPERRYVSYVGKFHTNGMQKGIPETIEASQKILREFDDVDFLFVGGPLSCVSSYLEQIKNKNLDRKRFVFLEKKPVQEVPLYLKASSALIMAMPRGFHFENCASPLKLFEYMSTKRPIIATKLKSTLEILTDKKSALLVRPNSIEELGNAIAYVLNHPIEAEKFSERAYQDVVHRTWDNRAKEILDFMNLK